jgi:AraC-like DNA-binding protein
MGKLVTISGTMLRLLSACAVMCGSDARTVFEEAGLDVPAPDSRAVRVRGDVFDRVWNGVAALSGDRDFGLHFGEGLQDAAGSGILFMVMMNRPTVGAALDALIKYHDLMNDALRPQVERAQGRVLLGWEVAHEGVRFGRHASETLLCVLNALFVRLTEKSCRPMAVHFQHEKPADVAEHERIFRAPLRFSQPESRLVLAKEDLERPVSVADPELLAALESFADKLLMKRHAGGSWSDRVLRSISKALKGNRPTVEDVARDLAIGGRTLQNRLREEGVTFAALLDRARKELALSLMENQMMPLYDAAFLLGFSEQSAFNHAFRRWTGSTPGEYRRGRASGKR